MHIIGTIRAKQDYVVEENDRGKAAPRKLGMAPIQREGFEYEFGIAFELQMDHRAAASKDRTGLFGIDVATGVKGPFYGETVDLADPRVGSELAEWASRGEANPVVSQEQIRAIEDAVARVELLDPVTGGRFRRHWTVNRFEVLSSPDRANDALKALSATLAELERTTEVGFSDAVEPGRAEDLAA